VPLRLGDEVQEVLWAERGVSIHHHESRATLQYVEGSSELGQARYAWIVTPYYRAILVRFMRMWTGLSEGMSKSLATKDVISVDGMKKLADKVEGGLTRLELSPPQLICLLNTVLSAGGIWDDENQTDKTNDEIGAWLDAEKIDAEVYYGLVLKTEIAMRTLSSFCKAQLSPEHADAQWSRGIASYQRAAPKVGRNQKCPCKSGKKFKKCCGRLA